MSLAEAREQCIDALERNTDHSDNIIARYINRDECKDPGGRACHAFLAYDRVEELFTHIHPITTYTSTHRYQAKSVEVCNQYLDWVYNRSPLRHTYLDHGDRWVESNLEVSYGELLAGLHLIRHTWEKGYVVNTWYELVGGGVEENLAFLLATMDNKPSYQGHIKYTWKKKAHEHNAIDPRRMSIKGVNRWLQGESNFRERPPYSSDHSGPESWKIWGGLVGADEYSDETGSFFTAFMADYPYTCDQRVANWDGSMRGSAYDGSVSNMVRWTQQSHIKSLLGLGG